MTATTLLDGVRWDGTPLRRLHAAIQTPDGTIYLGATHTHALLGLARDAGVPEDEAIYQPHRSGYVGESGVFGRCR
jgi:hypothetical protein